MWHIVNLSALDTYLNHTLTRLQRTAVGSRITLTSPDPGAAQNDKPQEWDTVHSDKGEVAFIPAELDPGRKIKNSDGHDQKVRGTVESIRVGDEL